MKRTTLFVEESVDHDLHALARRKGVPVSALVRESLTRYVAEQKRTERFAPRFLGQGHSGQSDVSERHEDFLLKALVTTDRRDFRRVRPKHISAFTLLP